MFKVGDYVMYGKNGVCRLTEICRSPFDESDTRIYYVLKPLVGSPAVIYTPVDNDKVALRALMAKKDADRLIEKMPSIEELTVENEKKRRDVYKAATASLYPEGFVSVIKTVRVRRRLLESERRHITEVDSEYESYAKRSLYGELSVVLGIPFEEIERYIVDKIAALSAEA